ncbi:MAG: ABC transporter substrate-binding protein [Chloroflexota bacterium]|nr:ABC transporter substrate-binding protein [Chloroflexota bacterium]
MNSNRSTRQSNPCAHGIDRRTLVKGAGASAIALGLGGAAARLGYAQAALPSPAADPMQIVLPETGVTLPSDDVTFSWVDSGDSKALFFREYFDTFTQAHGNITFDYLGLPWTEIQQIVPLGVRNGNAPDVFQVPNTIPVAEAVREGWVRPIDDLIPNYEAWKAGFPPSSFIEGVNVFNGRVYTFPRSTSKRGVHLTFFNRSYMEEAGYNPDEAPLTWDSFRDAARKITETGAGEYYGVILAGQQVGRWQEYVRNLGRLTGSAAGPDDIDHLTGEYAYTSDGYLAAIELLLALRDDGVVFPGSMSLNDPQARAQTPQGVAGMIMEGEWAMPIWIRENPDFDFGVTGLPIQGEQFVPVTYLNTATNHQWVYAESRYPEIAGEIFYYLGSEAGQLAFVSITGGSDPSIYASANQNAPLDDRMRQAYVIFDERMRLGPDVRIRKPETSQVFLNMVQPTPNFGETVQGIYSGQLDDPRQAMQDLKDRSERALDEAIAAAQAGGADVSRDDYVFPNWDPAVDYTEADYDSLG